MKNIVKTNNLPKLFYIVFDQDKNNYFRPPFQRNGITWGAWFSYEEAERDAKDEHILNYDIREIEINSIHPDFERIYKTMIGFDMESMFLTKLRQLIEINIFRKRR